RTDPVFVSGHAGSGSATGRTENRSCQCPESTVAVCTSIPHSLGDAATLSEKWSDHRVPDDRQSAPADDIMAERRGALHHSSGSLYRTPGCPRLAKVESGDVPRSAGGKSICSGSSGRPALPDSPE